MRPSPTGPDGPAAEDRLRELLGGACDDPALAATVGLDTPLRSLGLGSLQLVAFFASVETAFGFEWSEDTPSEALRDLGSMAAHIGSVGRTEPSGKEARSG